MAALPQRTVPNGASRRRAVGRRRLRATLVVALAGVLLGGPAFASADLDKIREQLREVEQQQGSTEKSKDKVEEQAAELDHELEHTSAALVEADKVLRETTARVETARVALAEAEADLADAEAEAERIETQLGIARANEAQIEQRLAANEDAQATSRATVGAIARESYKQGGMGSLATTLEVLAGETDAVEQMSMARTVLRVQDQQIRLLAVQEAEQVAEQDRLGGVRQDVAYLLALAEANVIAMEQARTAAEDAKTALEALEAEQAGAKAELEKQKSIVESDLAKTRQKAEDLSDELAKLAEEKHGLKAAEKAELHRLEQERLRKEEEERQRRLAEERARKAAEAAAAAKLAAEREAARQAQLLADAQRRQDAADAAEAQRRQQKAWEEEQAAAQKELEERRRQEAAARQQPVNPAPAPTPPSSSGVLMKPVNGPVTSEFGNRFHPVLRIWRLHDGIDFGAACGTPVYAAESGTVYTSAFDAGLGNYTVIDHGVHRGVNLTTAYAHFQSAAVVGAGQSVNRGQLIGYVGTTGTSTGCHLHFVTRENGTPVNPRTWL